jgi:hypothetical protein
MMATFLATGVTNSGDIVGVWTNPQTPRNPPPIEVEVGTTSFDISGTLLGIVLSGDGE